jgi:hypothetical protein
MSGSTDTTVLLPVTLDSWSLEMIKVMRPDSWAWHYDKREVFSVRSSYRMLIETWTMNRLVEGEYGEIRYAHGGEGLDQALAGAGSFEAESFPLASSQPLPPIGWSASSSAYGDAQLLCFTCHTRFMARSVWSLLPEEMVEVEINIQEPDARG